MSRFSVTPTKLPGLTCVERKLLGDSRGFLSRLFCPEDLREAGWPEKSVAQINHTMTAKRGTVRGLHFQYPPHAEAKLVSCVRGTVWDVAVDLRKQSPTYLHWHAEEISETNCRALLIPEGFAHGFQTLSDDVQMIYVHSAPYAQTYEGGIAPNDPMLAISWPLAISELSERDRTHPPLSPAFEGVKL